MTGFEAASRTCGMGPLWPGGVRPAEAVGAGGAFSDRGIEIRTRPAESPDRPRCGGTTPILGGPAAPKPLAIVVSGATAPGLPSANGAEDYGGKIFFGRCLTRGRLGAEWGAVGENP